MPDLSSTLEPLHELLRKDICWKWGKGQQEVFDKAKNRLQSSDVLLHYDPEKELVVSCDASHYGIGAVLAHVMKDGSEKPVAYASRTLSTAERNYGHLDKEALAVVFYREEVPSISFWTSFQDLYRSQTTLGAA